MPRGVYERKPKARKKGKWSKKARAMHSVRMKERWKAKQQLEGSVAVAERPTNRVAKHTKKDTIKARLLKVVVDAQAIIADLG